MTDYQVGQVLTHAMWGDGTVTEVGRTNAGDVVLTLDFGGTIGAKELLPRWAPMTTAEGTTYRPVASDYEIFDKRVQELAQDMRVRDGAKALLAYERAQANPADPFDAGTLGELLARPADPPMRVEGLIPSDASALLVAQRKTGKTTLILNWARSLVFGQPLLGHLETRPIGGNVGLLNFEVSAATVARWADEQGIPHDRLVVVNLRGRRNPLAAGEDREQLAEYLRAHDVEALAVDPFGRAYNGTSQNDSGEVGKWLVDLDAFVRSEVGATDLLLAAHAGWNGERTRGSSALEDWADVIVTMTRDQDDETQRFIRAMGRDVELEEDRLDYDAETRTLSLAGVGSRHKVKADGKTAELAVLVVRAAREQPGLSYSAAENLIRGMDDNPGFRNGEVSKAARYAADHGLLVIGKGTRGGASLTVVDPTSPTSPDLSRGQLSTSPTSPNRGEVEVGRRQTLSSPEGEVAS